MVFVSVSVSYSMFPTVNNSNNHLPRNILMILSKGLNEALLPPIVDNGTIA